MSPIENTISKSLTHQTPLSKAIDTKIQQNSLSQCFYREYSICMNCQINSINLIVCDKRLSFGTMFIMNIFIHSMMNLCSNCDCFLEIRSMLKSWWTIQWSTVDCTQWSICVSYKSATDSQVLASSAGSLCVHSFAIHTRPTCDLKKSLYLNIACVASSLVHIKSSFSLHCVHFPINI